MTRVLMHCPYIQEEGGCWPCCFALCHARTSMLILLDLQTFVCKQKKTLCLGCKLVRLLPNKAGVCQTVVLHAHATHTLPR